MKTENKNKKINYAMLFGFGAVVGLLIGIMIGMMIQQALIIEGFAALAPTISKMNVDINLNETFIVEETKRIAVEMLNYTK